MRERERERERVSEGGSEGEGGREGERKRVGESNPGSGPLAGSGTHVGVRCWLRSDQTAFPYHRGSKHDDKGAAAEGSQWRIGGEESGTLRIGREGARDGGRDSREAGVAARGLVHCCLRAFAVSPRRRFRRVGMELGSFEEPGNETTVAIPKAHSATSTQCHHPRVMKNTDRAVLKGGDGGSG